MRLDRLMIGVAIGTDWVSCGIVEANAIAIQSLVEVQKKFKGGEPV